MAKTPAKRSKPFEAHWEVNDGYAGKSRTQTTDLQIGMFEKDMTDEQIMDEIDRQVREDFDNRISLYFKDSVESLVSKVRAKLSDDGSEE